MKREFLLASMVFAGALGAAVPQVSSVTLVQDKASRLVTVTYALDAAAVVTVDFTTNGVSIGAANFQNAAGDVNARVEAGTGTITWRPDKSWPDHVIRTATFGATVRAWPLNATPTFLVADVATGAVNYYVDEDALPGGVQAERYKKTHLLCRRVAAAGRTYSMGLPAQYAGAYAARAPLHRVSLTNDFYLGVYETTQRQWELVKGTRPSECSNASYYEMRPVEKVSYDGIRGTSLGRQWPTHDDVDATSFCGVLRSRTGVRFDLPTCAQWEYACKAGTVTALYSDTNVVDAATLNPISRNVNNGGGTWTTNIGTNGGTAVVGSYRPNGWGFYDMLGNVYEWCLDRIGSNAQPDLSTELDPPGSTANTTYRAKRGGSAEGSPAANFLNTGYHGANEYTFTHRSVGFRVAVRLR